MPFLIVVIVAFLIVYIVGFIEWKRMTPKERVEYVEELRRNQEFY